jgi:hypothetical protein
MLEVAVQVERVDGTRVSDKANENAPSNYNLNVSLSERERTSDALVLNFQLELTTQPLVAKLMVGGTAALKGSKDEIQAAITAPDDTKPPLVLVTIYEKIYGLIYLVAANLKVPKPMPNLLKKGS